MLNGQLCRRSKEHDGARTRGFENSYMTQVSSYSSSCAPIETELFLLNLQSLLGAASVSGELLVLCYNFVVP